MSNPTPRLLLAVCPDIAGQIQQQLAVRFATPVCHRVATKSELGKALDDGVWDIAISELELDDFNALDLVSWTRERGIELPLVVIADSGGEDIALQCLEQGVDQCVLANEENLRRLPALVNALLSRRESEQRRQRIEDELRKSKERYFDVFDNTNDLIQCLAMDGSFLCTNRAWRDAMGYTEDEVRTMTLLDLARTVSNDSKPGKHSVRSTSSLSPKRVERFISEVIVVRSLKMAKPYQPAVFSETSPKGYKPNKRCMPVSHAIRHYTKMRRTLMQY